MKKLLVLFASLLVSLCLLADEVIWHTMTELTENIESVEKPVYIYFCFNNDHFSQLYEEEVLTDERVINTLNQDYYSVRFYAREDTNAYTIYGKTYKNKNVINSFSWGLLNAYVIMPVHVFLDQRPGANQNENTFNVIGYKEGYIRLNEYYAFLQETISTQQTVIKNNIIKIENNTNKITNTVKTIISADNFRENIVKVVLSMPEEFIPIKGEFTGGAGLPNTWEATVDFTGAISKGEVKQTAYMNQYYSTFLLAEAPNMTNWREAFTLISNKLVEFFPLAPDVKWEINEEELYSRMIFLYEAHEFYMDLNISNVEGRAGKVLKLVFWAN
ncbi:MAG: hypothetical protein KAT14_05885 [Candidatus Marinimicrobia bacterium]|nr:hypothetical protein [Candidatus Neomarinimicrobiota bacterium]